MSERESERNRDRELAIGYRYHVVLVYFILSLPIFNIIPIVALTVFLIDMCLTIRTIIGSWSQPRHC